MADPRKPTQFTRESAERIARVVRAAELKSAEGAALSFKRIPELLKKSKGVRAAVYSGAWAKGSTKVVSFLSDGQTALATNLTWPITASPPASQHCLIGNEGTSWWLIAPSLIIEEKAVIDDYFDAIYIKTLKEMRIVTGVSLSGCDIVVATDTIEYIAAKQNGIGIINTTTARFLTLPKV
jgi:hypothetical protein